LQNKVLLWIGERSYAIYLWHWVIFQVTRPKVDLAGKSWALYSLRFLIVLALADISLRYVELPIRRGLVTYWLKGLKYRTEEQRAIEKRRVIILITIIAFAIATIGIRAISIGEAKKAEMIAALETSTAISAAAPHGLWVTGDSVILGIRNALGAEHELGLVNARVGRQAPELIAEITHDLPSAPDGPIVFNLGNNNALTESEVSAIFELVKNQPKIIVVNTAVPRPWKDANNLLIARIASQYSNTHVVDWASISDGHPEYFAPDGIHLIPTGVDVYVASISKYL
jgi:hypothetical protein